MVKKWEYKVLDIDSESTGEEITKTLNELGRKGWELVSVQSHADDITGFAENPSDGYDALGDIYPARAFLKREITQ